MLWRLEAEGHIPRFETGRFGAALRRYIEEKAGRSAAAPEAVGKRDGEVEVQRRRAGAVGVLLLVACGVVLFACACGRRRREENGDPERDRLVI